MSTLNLTSYIAVAVKRAHNMEMFSRMEFVVCGDAPEVKNVSACTFTCNLNSCFRVSLPQIFSWSVHKSWVCQAVIALCLRILCPEYKQQKLLEWKWWRFLMCVWNEGQCCSAKVIPALTISSPFEKLADEVLASMEEFQPHKYQLPNFATTT